MFSGHRRTILRKNDVDLQCLLEIHFWKLIQEWLFTMKINCLYKWNICDVYKKCPTEFCLTDRTRVWSRKVDAIWMMKSWFCQTLLFIWTVAALEYNMYAIIMFGKIHYLKKCYCHAKILNGIQVWKFECNSKNPLIWLSIKAGVVLLGLLLWYVAWYVYMHMHDWTKHYIADKKSKYFIFILALGVLQMHQHFLLMVFFFVHIGPQ